MSWSVQIPPYGDGQPTEVLADNVLTAISDAQVIGLDMTGGPERQLVAAKAAARNLVSVGGPLAGKYGYRISLSGHCDPGDQSTAADCITVSVNEVRQPVAAAPETPEVDPAPVSETPAAETEADTPVDPDTGATPGAVANDPQPTEPAASVGETSAAVEPEQATETPAEPASEVPAADPAPADDTPVDPAPTEPEQPTPDAETPAEPETPANPPVQEG